MRTIHFQTLKIFIISFLLGVISSSNAQTINIGSGSYTTSFPGSDSAGRNGFPSGTPQLSGNALGKPVPTNDWWSKLIKENHADNLFNYPMTMKTNEQGLIVTYIPWGPIGDSSPIEIGLSGLHASMAKVSDYSDWTVTMNWNDTSHDLKATSGIGMPFIYFEKGNDDIVEIKINAGDVTISNEIIMVKDAASGADFVIYGPTGSIWNQTGNVYTSSLNGKNYWSLAMLPQSTNNVSSIAQEYKKYAYVFPSNTTTNWNYNESNAKMTSTFSVTTDIKEGNHTNILMGLLPHQWNNLAANSPAPNEYTYSTVRGDLKTLSGNSFTVENTFKGILPTLPNLGHYSPGFNPAALNTKISLIKNDQLATWTDSYNEGQVMNRLIQTARIAHQTGNIIARNTMLSTIKERLEDWLTYESGEVAFLYYYNNNWSTLLGYPAGHGQDSNINDHHFHWGYFIHAAAFIEQFEPGWANQWGEMINLLVRDAASQDRNDSLFPFLRNFSPYAGHSWANGFASFPHGNDQESTSESMQFASSLIHWGAVTNNDAIRDLGIYIYTTEQTAIEEYWLDIYNRNFSATHPYSLVSRVWGNSYDNGTFWTQDIAASYGIELYPMHGGSLYLGHHQTYAESLWTEMAANTGILSNQENPNLWHDTYWKFLALTDAQTAVDLYDSYPNRELKFGVSDAHTYHWLHTMNSLGVPDTSITANHPLAVAFDNNGETIYTAHNYTNNATTVTFSDGYMLTVPPNTLATSKDIDITGELSINSSEVNENDNVLLNAETTGAGITKVAFYNDDALLSEDSSAPYNYNLQNIELGIHKFYARVYAGETSIVTNIITVTVGDQLPYLDVANQIPGVIEAGNYDYFEGGNGQNIAYFDSSLDNKGDFRPEEYVDALAVASEGKTVGWISSGEWLEYTVNVETTGCYNLDMRYASGNDNGGGPIYFEVDGEKISQDISFPSTGGWENWNTRSTSTIDLLEGEHVIRLVATEGEINLGKMAFSYNDTECAEPGINTGLPFDFEASPITSDFINFDGGTGTVEAVISPQNEGNTSENLAKIVKNGGQPWAGSYINLNDALNFSSNSYITLKVWTDAPIGTPMQIKLEQQNGGNTFELLTNTSVTRQWEILSWDFSSLGVSAYDRLVFMFDFGSIGDGSPASTFYFDDVQQTATLSTTEVITTPISIYPNPVDNRLYVDSSSITLSKIEIYSLLGKKLIEVYNIQNSIDIQELSSGMYILKLYDENKYVTKKIIKK